MADESKFWRFVFCPPDPPDLDDDDIGPCWLWIAACDRDGYGLFRHRDVTYRAHRVAYVLLEGGSLDPTRVILHQCDNPPCCRPSHMKADSQLLNIIDMVNKGRQIQGEKHPNSKLTYEILTDVYKLKRLGWTQKSIAEKVGVNPSTISRVLSGNTWKGAPSDDNDDAQLLELPTDD